MCWYCRTGTHPIHPLHHADLRATLCRGNVCGRDESRDRGPAPGEHAVIHALEFFPRPETDIFLGGKKAFVDLKRWMTLRKVGIDHSWSIRGWSLSGLGLLQKVRANRQAFLDVPCHEEAEAGKGSCHQMTLELWHEIVTGKYWKYASLRVWMSKDQPNPCIFSAASFASFFKAERQQYIAERLSAAARWTPTGLCSGWACSSSSALG